MALIKKMTFAQRLEACGYLEESISGQKGIAVPQPKAGSVAGVLENSKKTKVAGVQRSKARVSGPEVRGITGSRA